MPSIGAECTVKADPLVLRGKLLPWAMVVAAAVIGGVAVSLLHGVGLLGQHATASGVLFFGIIVGGLAPRVLPTMVELRVDSAGFTVRDVFFNDRVGWGEVFGSFVVATTVLGPAVYFTKQSRGPDGPRFYRVFINNSYGLPVQSLRDILNRRRDQCIPPPRAAWSESLATLSW